jgi:hypothetical protein
MDGDCWQDDNVAAGGDCIAGYWVAAGGDDGADTVGWIDTDGGDNSNEVDKVEAAGDAGIGWNNAGVFSGC